MFKVLIAFSLGSILYIGGGWPSDPTCTLVRLRTISVNAQCKKFQNGANQDPSLLNYNIYI